MSAKGVRSTPRPAAPRPPAAESAPDFSPNYPSGGAQIGPCWQAMWSLMADGKWHDVRALVAVGSAAGEVIAQTARNQLFAAARARLIEPEARQDPDTARWRIWYRRPDGSES